MNIWYAYVFIRLSCTTYILTYYYVLLRIVGTALDLVYYQQITWLLSLIGDLFIDT